LHFTNLIERGWDVGGDDLSHGEGDAHHNQQLSVQGWKRRCQGVPKTAPNSNLCTGDKTVTMCFGSHSVSIYRQEQKVATVKENQVYFWIGIAVSAFIKKLYCTFIEQYILVYAELTNKQTN